MQSHCEQIDEDDLFPPLALRARSFQKRYQRQRWWQRMPKGERKKDQSLLMCESR